MFRISPQEARTDIYGINKGDAQVFDQSAIQDALKTDKLMAAQKAAKKEDEQKGRENKVYADVAGLESVKILPADRQYFADKQKAVQDYVVQNIGKLKDNIPISLW